MKQHTYQIILETRTCGLHTYLEYLEYTGSKTGAIKAGRSRKKVLNGIKTTLPIHVVIYDFNTEQYL